VGRELFLSSQQKVLRVFWRYLKLKLIESERISRSSIRLIVHDPNKWVSKLEEFKKKWMALLK